ncbi:MAG: DNA mismatch repair protein MutS [Gammaproteobacteria bacterium]|nr:DNA mismatch repair protein MutS [Gammaproteobacteria bacterium]
MDPERNGKNSRQRAGRNREVSADERDLFRQALAGVRPLQVDTVPLRPLAPRVPVRPSHASVSDNALASLRDPSVNELDHTDHLSFKRVGLRPTDMRKLKRGQFPCQGELDLHGRTATEAKSLLLDFLRVCRDRGLRCVRIVHGKGYRSPNQQAVLKPNIAHWLAQREEVVAYTSALPMDGGTGALYVLLNRLY